MKSLSAFSSSAATTHFPLEIWGRLRRGITPEINAISTIIFIFSLIAIIAWYRLRTRAEHQPETYN